MTASSYTDQSSQIGSAVLPNDVELAHKLFPDVEDTDIQEWYNGKNEDHALFGATTWAKDTGLYQIEVKDYSGEERLHQIVDAAFEKIEQKNEQEKRDQIDGL
jgi:hypothetical protein